MHKYSRSNPFPLGTLGLAVLTGAGAASGATLVDRLANRQRQNPLSLPSIKEYRLYLKLLPEDRLQLAMMRLRGIDEELAKNYRQAVREELNRRHPRKNVFWPPDEDDEYDDEVGYDELSEDYPDYYNPMTYPTHRNGIAWPGFSSYRLSGVVYGAIALLILRVWTKGVTNE